MRGLKFNKKTIIVIAIVLVGGFFIISNSYAGPGGGQTVDVTPVNPIANQKSATGTSTAANEGTPTASAKAKTNATPSATPKASATPKSSQLTAQQLAAQPGAIVLLNPATATPGSNVGITGVGFDPGQTVDVSVQLKANDKPQSLGFAQIDEGGSFGGVGYRIPDDVTANSFTITVQQHDGKKKASATGRITGGSVSVKLGTQVGKAGNQIAISAKGFAPNETVHVYFNSITSQPIATFTADGSGSIGQSSIKVPFGPAGNNNFIFVGEKSQSPVTIPFLMLTYYPSATISQYAAKADTTITFSGKDFGPSERVLIYLNSMSTPPIAVIQADDKGDFTNAGSFVIPFQLTGKNLLIFFGEMTQSSVTTGFDVLPYTPNAEPSTYGGQPGTSVTFYGSGFARNEIVRVYTGRGQGNSGKEVACFMSDNQGSIIGGSVSYTIPSNAQAGKMGFSLVGDKSKGEATATIQVMPASGPVQSNLGTQDQTPFTCPYDNPPAKTTSSTPTTTPSTSPTTTPSTTTPSPSTPTSTKTAQ